MLNERFKRQCNEIRQDRALRLDANQRESNQLQQQKQQLQAKDQEYMNQSAYNKQVSTQSQKPPSTPAKQPTTSSSSYLEPTPSNNLPIRSSATKPMAPLAPNRVDPPSPTNSGYVEPSKPVQLPIKQDQRSAAPSSGGYLIPASSAKSKQEDTYGGDTPGTYRLLPEHDTYSNSLYQQQQHQHQYDNLNNDSSRYVNEDVVNEMDRSRFAKKPLLVDGKIEYIDQDDDGLSKDGYMMPRHASTMSAGSTASSTAPLLKSTRKEKPAAPIRPVNSKKVEYIPPPASLLANNSNNKFSMLKPPNETEV